MIYRRRKTTPAGAALWVLVGSIVLFSWIWIIPLNFMLAYFCWPLALLVFITLGVMTMAAILGAITSWKYYHPTKKHTKQKH